MTQERQIILEPTRIRDSAAPEPELAKDEIDLSELFKKVRPALFPALVVGLICGILMVMYANTLDKTYTAVAQFAIDDGGGSAVPDLGGAFEGLIPTGQGGNESERAEDKIMSRDFIMELFDKTDIEDDPYFTEPDPIWLLRLLGAPTSSEGFTPAEKNEQIVEVFRTTVSVAVEKNGIINVSVNHEDPAAAAVIANAITQTHIDNIENKRITGDQRSIELMADRLTEAREKLDEASIAAQNYALENNVQSKEELGASSLKLTGFRREILQNDAILAAIDYLQEQRRTSGSDTFSMEEFFENHFAAFRPLERELGWVVSGGRIPLPSAERLNALETSYLADREPLERALRVLEAEANQNAEAAGRLVELEREIQVRQAVYEGLVTQFEAQILGTQLKDEEGEWIQVATAPLKPSAPKVAVMASVATVLGMMLVLGAGVIRATRPGRIYTAQKLARPFKGNLLAQNVGRIVGHRPQSLTGLVRSADRLKDPALVEYIAVMGESGIRAQLIVGAPWTPVMRNLAGVIGAGIAADGKHVAIVDLTQRARKSAGLRTVGTLLERDRTADMALLQWTVSRDAEAGGQKLEEALAQVADTFDHLIIVGAPLEEGVLQNRTALRSAERVLVVTRTGVTRRDDLDRVTKLLSQAPGIHSQVVVA